MIIIVIVIVDKHFIMYFMEVGVMKMPIYSNYLLLQIMEMHGISNRDS